MRHRMQWRYFAVLLIPLVMILSIAVALISITHNQGMAAMRKDVETNRMLLTQSVADSLSTLIEQIRQSSTSVAIQIEKANSATPQQLELYRNAIEQMTFLHLNAESMLNPLVNRAYVFLFSENRGISMSSPNNRGDELYSKYFRFLNQDYDAFQRFSSDHTLDGVVLADVTVGYMDETYQTWAIAQTIPSDPHAVPTGVMIYTLSPTAIEQHLAESLADDDSACLLVADNGAIHKQGVAGAWDEVALEQLREDAGTLEAGVYTLDIAGEQYLASVAISQAGKVIAAQPVANAYQGVELYHRNMMLLSVGMLLLCLGVAGVYAQYNMKSMRNTLSLIAPQNQSQQANTVFEYMQEAIRSSQETEALLSAKTEEQRFLLRKIFLRRLLRGELPLASDILREQSQVGLNLEGAYWTVALMCFFPDHATDTQTGKEIEKAVLDEFGGDAAYLTEMSPGAIACLLCAQEEELRDSMEALAETLVKSMAVSLYVSSTVSSLTDISRAWRQVRAMSRMDRSDAPALHWYGDLFQDDALYNFEYSVYMENKLRNSIAAGSAQATQEILQDLYRNNLKGSAQSDHILRLFAYDLYRLVNHLNITGEDEERASFLRELQSMLDAVMEDSRGFDAFYARIRDYCLHACALSQSRQQHNNNHDLIERVCQYIQENYADPSLAVSSIATAFHLSDKYLSQLFKEQTGSKISAFIEQKRIDLACRLLRSTTLSVSEVGVASGYALTHTFRVAFKRSLGVTPLEWKKVHGEENVASSSEQENERG